MYIRVMEMKQTNTKRELMLDLYEVGESLTVWAYIGKMFDALKNDKITNEQYDLLSGDLLEYCKRENIPTTIQF